MTIVGWPTPGSTGVAPTGGASIPVPGSPAVPPPATGSSGVVEGAGALAIGGTEVGAGCGAAAVLHAVVSVTTASTTANRAKERRFIGMLAETAELTNWFPRGRVALSARPAARVDGSRV